MALLEILHHPDPRLRNRAFPVEAIDASIQTLIDDMLETMYQAPGIGLAATQVNVAKRLLVLDVSEDKQQPMCFINPQILETRDHTQTEEGCLSVPGITDKVNRAKWIRVQALDRNGSKFELETDGLLAVCIQHEIDHLDGKLFIDYLSDIKRYFIRKRLEKKARTENKPKALASTSK
jgi:peptide deformylase